MDAEKVKEELVIYGKKVVSSGLVTGAGGNISARCGKVIYLSASGLALEEIRNLDSTGYRRHVSSGR